MLPRTEESQAWSYIELDYYGIGVVVADDSTADLMVPPEDRSPELGRSLFGGGCSRSLRTGPEGLARAGRGLSRAVREPADAEPHRPRASGCLSFAVCGRSKLSRAVGPGLGLFGKAAKAEPRRPRTERSPSCAERKPRRRS